MKNILITLLFLPTFLVGQQISVEDGKIYYQTNYLGKDVKLEIADILDNSKIENTWGSASAQLSACDCVDITNNFCSKWNNASTVERFALIAYFAYYENDCQGFSDTEIMRCRNYKQMLNNCEKVDFE